MTVATFGTKEENVDYVNRYGVYAVIPNPTKEQIILVQAPNGAWFLPGGEIEAGEDEYFYSSHRDTHYYNPAYIYEVTDFVEAQKPLEDFNNISWFPIDEAIEKLKRGSHKWGIKMWKSAQKL